MADDAAPAGGTVSVMAESDSDNDDLATPQVLADSTGSASVPSGRRALAVSAALVLVLAGLAGWLGFSAHTSTQAEDQRALFLAAGRQGALNLTTIDHVDADTAVQRILDTSAGAFHEDFAQRSEPFVEVVKQSQAKSEGTVTEAGLESMADDQAQVVVSVSVKTTSAGQEEQQPRLWRMRIHLVRIGVVAKMSEVSFVQ